MKLTFTCLLLLLISTASFAEKPRQYHYIDEAQIKQVQIQGEASTVLVNPWRGLKKIGAAIILPAAGEGADSPGLIAFLRRELAPVGWTSLSLESPQAIPHPNFATAAEEVSKAGSKQLSHPNNQAMPDYSDEALDTQINIQTKYLIASLNQLDDIGNDYPGHRMLIVSDTVAGLTISLLKDKKIPQPDILVVINPYLKSAKQNAQLAKSLAELEMPILDIHSPDAHHLSQLTMTQRKSMAPHNRPKRYQQRQLSLNLNNPSAWQACLDVIEGFAYRIVK